MRDADLAVGQAAVPDGAEHEPAEETVAPFEAAAPVETVKPEVPAQIDDAGELNIVGVSSKPAAVTDDTKAYTPVKDKEAAK